MPGPPERRLVVGDYARVAGHARRRWLGRVGRVTYTGTHLYRLSGLRGDHPEREAYLMDDDIEPATREDWEVQRCLDRLGS